MEFSRRLRLIGRDAMNLTRQDCCVLNSGSGAWAFEQFALNLSSALGIEVSENPRRFNYALHFEPDALGDQNSLFIPQDAIHIASDKRKLAAVFLKNGVSTPRTIMVDSFSEVLHFSSENSSQEWCLKFPTSCGANGHALIAELTDEPPDWPRPFVIQEFIRLASPEVYRTYCAAGELFGWVVRRFPQGSRPSPWVAHAKGARYSKLGDPPPEASVEAQRALIATGLWNSFGCADLLRKPGGEWVVLEVGTDGGFNHVDRDLGFPDFEDELNRRVAGAFWKAAEKSGLH